ncbi:hypothetical protein WJX77_008718 [Trebouxia sp. C0004]
MISTAMCHRLKICWLALATTLLPHFSPTTWRLPAANGAKGATLVWCREELSRAVSATVTSLSSGHNLLPEDVLQTFSFTGTKDSSNQGKSLQSLTKEQIFEL